MFKEIYYLAFNLILNPLFSLFSLRKQNFNFRLNKKRIKELKNIYKGKQCLIVGPAPSLNIDEFKAFQEKNNPIVFTFNSMVIKFKEIDFIPDFYSIIDPKIFNKFFKLATETFSSKTTFLLPRNFRNFNRRTILFNYSFLSHFIEFFKLKFLRKFLFSTNPPIVVFDGFTVFYFTLQLALFMGFSTINIMGIDLNYTVNGKYSVDYPGSPPANPLAEKRMNIYFNLFLDKAKNKGIKVLNKSTRSPLNFND